MLLSVRDSVSTPSQMCSRLSLLSPPTPETQKSRNAGLTVQSVKSGFGPEVPRRITINLH